MQVPPTRLYLRTGLVRVRRHDALMWRYHHLHAFWLVYGHASLAARLRYHLPHLVQVRSLACTSLVNVTLLYLF